MWAQHELTTRRLWFPDESALLAASGRVLVPGHVDYIFTDGSKVYNKLAKAYGLQHKFVAHSKSEWPKTESAGSHGRLRVNTGLIDERWKCIKGFVPVSPSGGSRDESTFSPHLFNYLYSWWLRTQVSAAQERIKLVGKALQREA
eukprot:s2816_g7.t1